MKLPAPNSAAWVTTRCTAWYTLSAKKISTSGWPHGRRRNSNGRNGKPARARSSGFHSEIYFQPRSQSHRHSVFFSGAHGSVCGDVSVAADAHPLALAERYPPDLRRDPAGDIFDAAYHAR